MKKLTKFIRKIKRNRLYSEKNRIQNRLTELNNAIHKIDCDNQAIEMKEKMEFLLRQREIFLQKVLEELTADKYTPCQIDHYKEEIEEARNGNSDSYHLLRNNFQYNSDFKKETGVFKNA
jgi:hypothetical protein